MGPKEMLGGLHGMGPKEMLGGLHGMGPNKEDTPHAIFDKCNYKLIVSKHRTIFG